MKLRLRLHNLIKIAGKGNLYLSIIVLIYLVIPIWYKETSSIVKCTLHFLHLGHLQNLYCSAKGLNFQKLTLWVRASHKLQYSTLINIKNWYEKYDCVAGFVLEFETWRLNEGWESYLISFLGESLVSRTGTVGWTELWVKVPKCAPRYDVFGL